jgi:hypothetical protein
MRMADLYYEYGLKRILGLKLYNNLVICMIDVIITLFRSITILYKIFPTFNLYIGNIPWIMSVPRNIVMDLNNVMMISISKPMENHPNITHIPHLMRNRLRKQK